MRVVWVLVLLASALAGEPGELDDTLPDGAIAEPARWTGPHGPASNSRRSRALAVTRDVVEAWAVQLPGRSVAPPVSWGAHVYALCEARKGHILCGLDLATGKLEAKKQLPKAPAGELHAWGRNVFLQSDETQISAYRMAGGSFLQSWKTTCRDPLNALMRRFTGNPEEAGEVLTRLKNLEDENADLRQRLEQGRDGVERLLAKVRFLENQK
jgi:hypothetical protein